MASRSTRNKVKFQAGKVKNGFSKIYEHAQKLEEIAEGKSDMINEELPLLVKLTLLSEEYWDDFIARL